METFHRLRPGTFFAAVLLLYLSAGVVTAIPTVPSRGKSVSSLQSLQTSDVGTGMLAAAKNSLQSGFGPQGIGSLQCSMSSLFSASCASSSVQTSLSPVSSDPGWTNLGPPNPSPRTFASMAYDSADGYVVLFGGALSSGNGVLGDTWKFSNGHWTLINTALAPTARLIQSMAYDSADGYIILFGGFTLVGTQPKTLADTWKFSNGAWSNITGPVGPSPRLATSMAYDGSAADAYVVLFGGLPALPPPGASVGNALKDTWKFSGGTWTNITGSSGPSARAGAMIGYDPVDGFVLLYGGAVQSSVLGDTWKFSGGLWSGIASSNAPGPRALGSMAFDAAAGDNYLIFFGGGSTLSTGLSGPHHDTWKYSGGVWTNITATGPPDQFGSGIAYDGSSTDGYVLLLGVGGVSWKFSGGPWTFIPTFWIPGPSARVGASMAYDVADGYVLLFGGSSNVSINGINFHDTWKFQSGSWTNVTTSNGPPSGHYESMAYDAADGYIVLLTNQGTTWRFGGGVWTLVSTPTSPGYRSGASMVYDAVDQYVVLFGGCCRPGSILPYGDTWTFHAGTWTNATSIGRPSPSARLYASMAYDSIDGYGVLFGGVSILPTSFPFAGSLGDTWTFSNGSWKNVTMAMGPPPPSSRALATLVYDRAAGYVLLFGGVNGQTGFVGDTWRFSGETWNYIPTGASPGARSNGSIAYDDADHYAVLFGGTSSATGLGDTWTWSVASSPWTPLEITGTRPSPRIFGSMTYDAADGYVILFGGVSDFTFSNAVQLHDTWKFLAGTWTNITSTSGVPCFQPCPRFGGYFQMAYDAADGYVVMPSGDSVGSTWVFRAGGWTNINLGCTKTTCPSFRYHYSVTYDAADQSVLLFGGMNGSSTPPQPLSDTWEFHAGVWTKVMTPTQPSPPRAHAAMAYDSADGYAILFGGDFQISSSSFKMFGDTWKFAGGTWTNITTANGPAPRTVSTMTYDAADGYVLLVDGSNYMGNFGDTWKFIGGAWTNIPTDVSPLARSHSFITYDGADGSVVLFGGGSYPVPLSDTWTWRAPPSVFDYSLSNDGPVTIQPGSSGTVTITATLTSGTSQQVTLSCVSATLPAGITCGSFTNNPLTPTASSGLTINVASSVANGVYYVEVTASPMGANSNPTLVIVQVGTAPNYLAAVKVGDNMMYNVVSLSYQTNNPTLYPNPFDGLNTADHFTKLVTAVSGPNATMTVTRYDANGGVLDTSSQVCDVLYALTNPGSAIDCGFTPLIAGGLHAPESVSPRVVWTLNKTETETVLGAVRTVNLLNVTYISSTLNETAVITWDQASGIMLEWTGHVAERSGTQGSAQGDFHLVLTQTNIWTTHPDFAIYSVPPAVTIPQGYTASINLVFVSLGGFSGTINYVSPSPGPGLLQNPNTANVQANGKAGLTALESVTHDISPGAYTLQITWVSGSLTHTVSIPINVVPLSTTPGISLSVSPSSLNIPQGGSTTATVTLNSLNGFAGSVTLYNFFSGLSTSFTPTTVELTSGQSVNVVLTIAASSTTAPGTYNVDVEAFNGTGRGGPYDSKFINVTVPAATTFDYTLSLAPTSRSIVAGSTVTFTITATLTVGTGQSVALLLSISPQPTVCNPVSGVSPCGSITLSPTVLTPTIQGATSTLTITTTMILPAATYTFTINGSPAGASSSSASFTLTIVAPSVKTVGCGHGETCQVLSNATLSKVKLAGNTIHIEADGPHGAHGYANVTIPKSEIPNIGALHVFVDNGKLADSMVTITSNSTAYFIYFTFTFHSPVKIDIQLSALQQTPNVPTILGIDQTLFYEIIGGVITAVVIVSAVVVVTRRRKTKPPA